MTSACPTPGPDEPLVRSLLGVVDCNTEQLVHGGYSALSGGSGAFSGVLTILLTIYVALIGYQLLLGRSELRITDFVLNAVKIGAVLALATQWETYQAIVYQFLFSGPDDLASTLIAYVQPDQSSFRGDVFDGLQRAFDDLSTAANGLAVNGPSAAGQLPGAPPNLLGGAGAASLALTASATVLLLSSLGVILAAKIVLGLLLAMGPIFIALALFDATRGLFEGWLRAGVAFAFAPLASTLLLGVALTMMEPSLLQIEALHKQGLFTPGPVYGIATLILVFAGVSLGALIAGGMVASRFRLPGRVAQATSSDVAIVTREARAPQPVQSRATRVAVAATAMERRDPLLLVAESQSSLIDRRTTITTTSPAERTIGRGSSEPRLGQAARRGVRPRTPRPSARRA